MTALAAVTKPLPPTLEQLVWRGDQLAAPLVPGIPSGFSALDAQLPGGGWPVGALSEILVPKSGIGELSLLLPLLAKVPAGRWAVCIAAPVGLYPLALARAGIPLERLLLVHAQSPAHARWAARQALASRSCAVVLLWLADADMGALRRLQLAAEDSATPLILIRPRHLGSQASPAVLRLALQACPEGVEIRILKRRGTPLATPLFLPLPRPTRFQPNTSSPGPRVPETAQIHALVRPASPRSGPAGLYAGTA